MQPILNAAKSIILHQGMTDKQYCSQTAATSLPSGTW